MAISFVLDSDVLIDLFAGREPAGTVTPSLLEMDLAGTTAVTVYELYSGAGRSRDRRGLDEFLATQTILPWTPDRRGALGLWTVDLSLRSRGRAINPGDKLIAGICLAHDKVLVTRNVSHFQRVADLKVVTLEEISG